MSKNVIVKTQLAHKPKVLVFCGREPYEVFPVREDGTVEGLTVDHPRFTVLKGEWKLVVEEVVVKPQDKPAAAPKKVEPAKTEAPKVETVAPVAEAAAVPAAE